MAGWEAHAAANDIDDSLHIFLRRFLVNAAGQRWLVDLDMAHSVHQQIGQLVRRIAAIAGDTADAHIDKWLVAGEEISSRLRW